MRAVFAFLYVVGAARALAPFAGPRALLAELVAHAGPSSARLDFASRAVPNYYAPARAPGAEPGREIACYRAGPPGGGGGAPLLVVVHEFFGLSEAICRKADALATELECEVRGRAIRAPRVYACVCAFLRERAFRACPLARTRLLRNVSRGDLPRHVPRRVVDVHSKVLVVVVRARSSRG